MKNRNLFVWIVMATVGLTACSDDMEEGRTVVTQGEEIQFGASGMNTFGNGYTEAPQSRTAYGDATFDGTNWHYPLNWVYGDGVSIYCTATHQDADYEIKWEGGSEGQESTDGTNVYLQVGGEEDPLKWGDPNTLHTFYAFYPTDILRGEGSTFTNGVLESSISNVQDPVSIEEDGAGNYIAKPNMNNAFMRAVYSVMPMESGGVIHLEFKPLVTAVDITLTAAPNVGEDGVRISQMQVSSQNKAGTDRQAVCGKFAYDIDKDEVTLKNEDVANDYQITVSLWKNNEPLTLHAGQSVTVTVFLLPGNNHSDDPEHNDRTLHNLQIRVPNWEGKTKVKYYDGVDIPVGTKSQVILPKLEKPSTDYDVNTWMKSIADNVYVAQLSIPGASSAFSKDILNNKEDYSQGEEIVQAQMQTVEEQFAAGVRAFEIPVEKAGLWSSGDNSKSLGDALLIAGGDYGSKFSVALSRLAKLVADNPTEFIVVMPFYQTNDSQDRNDEAWCHNLKNYLQATSAVDGVPLAPFSNSLVVGDARGKILFLSRMPGTKEEVDRWVGAPAKTTAIYEWDGDKDRWGRRGYDITNNSLFGEYTSYVPWRCWTGSGDPTSVHTAENNWVYEAATPDKGAITYHIQDWYRVAPGTATYNGQKWNDSKNEKIEDIQNFLVETTTALKNNTTAEDVYINSISGFYVATKPMSGVEDNYSQEPYPTDGSFAKRGDIPQFARDMNKTIYQYILDLTPETRGPLGIVLINYVNVAQAFGLDVYGDYIIHALIDNNFRTFMTGDPNYTPKQ